MTRGSFPAPIWGSRPAQPAALALITRCVRFGLSSRFDDPLMKGRNFSYLDTQLATEVSG